MPEPDPQAAPAGTPGLLRIETIAFSLKPQALLQRLRPITLAAAGRYLQSFERYTLAHRLVEDLFPGRMRQFRASHWWEALHYLACLVEEFDWFEIDWDVLNEAWACWLELAEEDQGDHLAAFLCYMPVRLYGFSQDDFINGHNQVYELIHVLLADASVATAGMLIEAELYDEVVDNWTEADRAAAWQRLDAIEADPGQYPEPVRLLPEIARWVCGRTGNPILDCRFDPYQDGPWHSWAEDLERIKAAWRRARPVLACGQRLEAWYEQDNGNLSALAHFLMEGTNNYEQFDW